LKRVFRMLMVLLVIALFLPAAGTGVADTVLDSGIVMLMGRGDSAMPDYSWLPGRIGEGLTADDFRITYSDVSSADISVDANGCVTVADDAKTPGKHTYLVHYRPRSGTGKTTIFSVAVRVYEPVEDFTIQEEEMVLAVGETAKLTVDQPDDTVPGFSLAHDPTYVTASFSSKDGGYKPDGYLTLKGVAAGETTVTLTAHNGTSRTVRIHVKEFPTWIRVTADKTWCYTGDTISLTVEMDGGCYRKLSPWVLRNTYWYSDADDWLSKDQRTFVPQASGMYDLNLRAYNEQTQQYLPGTVRLLVYDRSATAYLQPLSTPLKVGFPQSLTVLDVNGNAVTVPLEIVEGQEYAEITGINTLTPKAEGKVTVRATAMGMTHEMTYEISDSPTSMTMPYDVLRLKVGETANIMPIFDKGTAEVTWFTTDHSQSKPYIESVIRLSKNGDVVALSPGEVSVLARVDGISSYGDCRVIVEDSEKTRVIDQPSEPFGVGHTYQLRVVDKAGAFYPATFEVQPGFEYVEVSADGLMTGVKKGEAWITATLEDGHTIKFKQTVIQIPNEISAGNAVFKLNDSLCYLPTIMSDVGDLAFYDVTVEVANPAIVRYSSGQFTPMKIGSTQVHVTAINGGASCTFTVTVEPPTDVLYPDQTWVYVPDGYSVPLPRVRDYYGNIVDVSYEITGPNKVTATGDVAFRIIYGMGDVDYIRCYWGFYTTQVTATAKDGRTCKFSVQAYRLPDRISFWEPEITLQPGESKQVELHIAEQGYQLGSITWSVKGDSGAVRFMEYNPDTGRPTVTALKEGTATLRAVLLNGAAAECRITVTAGEKPLEPPQSISLSTENRIRALAGGATLQILMRHYPGTSSDSVTWSVDNDQAGSVDAFGLFTAARPAYDQTVTIIASSVADPDVKGYYTLTVLGYSDAHPGDVNGDGTVDGRDTVRLLRYLVGEGVTIVEANADVNSDGVVDGRDSIRLLLSML